MRKINLKYLLIAVTAVFLTALIGSMFTEIGAWYESIKPSITPPSYVFPIAWTILFVLIAVSMYISLTRAKKHQKKVVAVIFSINLVLNILWSFLFFKLKSPFASLIEILLLWISIVLMLAVTYKINKTSFYLIIPYLLWVSFATLLNYLIVFG
ncbi:MAG: TspO/MBR family protein [Candidatus Pacearchaeota archaeon]